MTMPTDPPTTVGTQPKTADELNGLVGLHLRNFCGVKATVGQDHEFLAGANLTAAPYYFTSAQETLIKSAIADLDTALDAVNMTFISQIVGMF